MQLTLEGLLMPPRNTDSVPGVDDSQLAAVTSSLLTLPNIRSGDVDRFTQAIRTLAENCAQNDWANEGNEDAGVFVMVNHPRQVGEKFGAQPFTDPIAKNQPVLGKLFFTNRDASAGRSMQMPVPDSNRILEWLQDNELDAVPIIIIYRNSKKMVTRKNGINDYASICPIRDHPPSATIQELTEALEHFHLNQLLIPTSCPVGVWENGRAQDYVPGSQPEKSIQSGLGIALNFWFRGIVKAEHEDKTNIGRIDVRLLVKDQLGLSYWAIIELKVIKSFSNAPNGSTPSRVHNSKNVTSIIEGIKQAWAFRKNREADEGLLEIFDLRKEKSVNLMVHSDVEDTIKNYTPTPKWSVRAMFGSASDARTAGFSGI